LKNLKVNERGEMLRGIYRLLEIPFIYELATSLLAPGGRRLIKPLHQKAFRASTGRVLDVGCGPSLNTPAPQGLIVGVDINPSYVRQYTGGFVDQEPQLIFNPPPARQRLGFVVSADQLPFPDGSFDEARSNAIFHHLPEAVALKALQEMKRCLRPGGRIVLLDAVWPEKAWKRPLAWLTLRFDRGTFVRSQEQMLRLSQEACPGDWKWERRTITYTGMEYLCLEYIKIY
jgi:SAM-dependent methyltransferase